jgi:hypothetical protein
MHVGEYIKWTGQEGGESFSYVGQIISINEVWVEMQTAHGRFCVKRTDGTFEASEPVALEVKSAAKPTLNVPKRDVKEGSKLERAVAIYKAMAEPTRGKLIEAFVAQLGMTPAGASTYAAQVRKIA